LASDGMAQVLTLLGGRDRAAVADRVRAWVGGRLEVTLMMDQLADPDASLDRHLSVRDPDRNATASDS
jgi:hypothetical protein